MNTTALPTTHAIRLIDHAPTSVAQPRLERLGDGPVLTASAVAATSPAWRVRFLGAPGAAIVDDEIVLLVTVAEDVPTGDDGAGRSTMTHLRVARSSDGVNFTVEEAPFLVAERDGERYGVEDARVTRLGDRWVVTYTAVSDAGCATGLVETFDFDDTYRLGLIFHPSNSGVSIFPDHSGGLYRALHRPVDPTGAHSIWYAESPDLLHWGNHHKVMSPSDAVGGADLGGGPPAILTDGGWLQLFRSTDDHGVPTIEAALLHRWDPTQVLARSSAPLLIGRPGSDLEVGGMVELDGTLVVYMGEHGETHAATIGLDALVDSLV